MNLVPRSRMLLPIGYAVFRECQDLIETLVNEAGSAAAPL